MELRQLRHFVAVVEKGNLSDAATEALITQPAMSRSIKALEDSLQVRLLDRLPRGIAVTEAGQKLFVEAQFILNECERIHTMTKVYDAGLKGTVKLGVAPLFSATVIRSVVTHLKQHHPGIKLEIREAIYSELIENLRMGEVDLAVSIYPEDDDLADLSIESLYKVSTSIIVGNAHPLAKQKEFSTDAFMEEKWVTTYERESQNEVVRFLTDNAMSPPQDVVVTNSLLLLRALVLNDGYICLAATDIFRDEILDGRVKMIRLPSGISQSPAGIISRTHKMDRGSIQIVMDAIRNTCVGLDQGPDQS